MNSQATTLIDVVRKSGHRESRTLAKFTQLAAAAQHSRRAHSFSDRDEITRSTALWTLVKTDYWVADALSRAGLESMKLGTVIGLSGAVPDAASKALVPVIDPLFADAVRDYAETVPIASSIGPLELAIAILRSSQIDTAGELPGRLRRLGLDHEAAIKSLEQTRLVEASFSVSVREVRKNLRADSAVTAGKITAEIQKAHPGYGDGRFVNATVRTDSGQLAPMDEWLNQVMDLYDLKKVASTRHEVIDGELVVIGLAEVEATVWQDLTPNQVLERMRQRAETRPKRPQDQTRWSSDAPARKDTLGRRFIAEALAKMLKALAVSQESPKIASLPNESNRPDSFIVHIDGPWGSGKTSLFHFLKANLEKDFLVVQVNAWREQQLGVQWWTLHRALREAVEAEAERRPGKENDVSVGELAGDQPKGASPAGDASRHEINVYRRISRKIQAGLLSRVGVCRRITRKIQAKLLSRVDVIATRPMPFVLAVVIPLILLLAGGVFFPSVAEPAKILPLAIFATTAISLTYRYLLPESHRSAEAFIEKSSNPMSEVRVLFARTLKRSKNPVVFLIDDLDRCEPKYVIEFLDVVQNLVRDAPAEIDNSRGIKSRGPYAFIAADGGWIRSSYENHYSSISSTEVPGRPLGYLFLEKIFQLQLRLPIIDEGTKKEFYDSLLDLEPAVAVSHEEKQKADIIKDGISRARSISEIHKATEGRLPDDPRLHMEVLGEAAVKSAELADTKATLHELAPFGRFLDPNPRSIKLFVNTYCMTQSLRILENIRIGAFPLALWTVLEIRWPLLADYLRGHPEHIDKSKLQGAGEPEVFALFSSDEVQSVIANSGWGALTATHVRQCSGGLGSNRKN